MGLKLIIVVFLLAVARQTEAGYMNSHGYSSFPAQHSTMYSAQPSYSYMSRPAVYAAQQPQISYPAPAVQYAAQPHVSYASPRAIAYSAPALQYAAPRTISYAAPTVQYAAPRAIAYSTPAVKPVAQTPEPYDAHPQYNFEYSVSDPTTGDSKSQHESRDGDSVKGSYSLIEADGSRRTVDYTADDVNGFVAVVKKESGVAPAAKVMTNPMHYAHAPVHYDPAQVRYAASPVTNYASAPSYPYSNVAPISYAAPAPVVYAASKNYGAAPFVSAKDGHTISYSSPHANYAY